MCEQVGMSFHEFFFFKKTIKKDYSFVWGDVLTLIQMYIHPSPPPPSSLHEPKLFQFVDMSQLVNPMGDRVAIGEEGKVSIMCDTKITVLFWLQKPGHAP